MTTPSSNQRIKRKLGRADYVYIGGAFLIIKEDAVGALTLSMNESEGSSLASLYSLWALNMSGFPTVCKV